MWETRALTCHSLSYALQNIGLDPEVVQFMRIQRKVYRLLNAKVPSLEAVEDLEDNNFMDYIATEIREDGLDVAPLGVIHWELY